MDMLAAIPFPREKRRGTALEFLPNRRFVFSSVVLILLSGLLFFTKLSAPLLEPEEARYAEIPRQMLKSNHFLAPVLNGQLYYHKPPFLYWLVMTSYQIFGVHDWAARLVPGSAAVLTILLVYWLGRRVFGERAAFLGALILCLTPRYLYLGRMLTTDVLLALWTTAALLAALRAAAGRRAWVSAAGRRAWWGWWWLSAICCGLGILTKGPLALALVAPPILIYTWLQRATRRPTLFAWIGYTAIAIGIAAPWYLSMALYDWRAFVDFFWLHNIVRFTAPIDHAKPFWFFLPSVLLGTLPWSLTIIPLGLFLFRIRRRLMALQTPVFGFALLAFLWMLVFFSCAGCKRAVYILPALPMLALAFGAFLSRTATWREICWRGMAFFALPAGHKRIAVLVTAAILFTAVNLAVIAVVVRLWDVEEAAIVVICGAGGIAVLLYHSRRLSAPVSWLCCAGALFLLQWGAVYALLPDYNRRFSLRGIVRPLAKQIAKKNTAVACYPRTWDSVSYYLRGANVYVFAHDQLEKMTAVLSEHPRTLTLVQRSSLNRFLAELPTGYEFVPHARQREKIAVGIMRQRQRDSMNLLSVDRRDDTKDK